MYIISIVTSSYSRLSSLQNQMNGVLGHNSVLEGFTVLGTTWAIAMNFVMNHVPGAGSILIITISMV